MEAEDVVRLCIMLHLLKRRTEVVGVEERFAARVGGQRAQQLLRGKVGAERIRNRRTRVRRRAAQAPLGRIAHGRQRLQTACVHGVDGHVRLGGLVGRGAQAGLVFDAVAREPAGKVQHALALIHLLQRLRHLPDRIQLAVGVQVVVLRVIGGERGCVVAGTVRGPTGAAVGERCLVSAVVSTQLVQ